jgi:DNA-binding HxlR family transcriptional regulator
MNRNSWDARLLCDAGAPAVARTDKKVSYSPTGKLADVTPEMAARGIEHALRLLDGRWKPNILFNLFSRESMRFSELERAIPGVSQKMLTQQLRELETDGLVTRTVHAEVPPKVEYALTDWGRGMCPALNVLLTWVCRGKPLASR